MMGFQTLIFTILQINEYKNFKRAWVMGDYSLSNDWDIEKAITASCHLPSGAREYDFLFLLAKLIQGRKGEIDLKYIWHHVVPYGVTGSFPDNSLRLFHF